MIKITIEGKQGEGKTTLAKAILALCIEKNKTVSIREKYEKPEYFNRIGYLVKSLKNPDVQIFVTTKEVYSK